MFIRRYVQVIRSRVYSRVIQVDIPIRFYWNGDDSFDGVEFGPIPKKTSTHQRKLLFEVLGRLHLEPMDTIKSTPIPEVYLKAFKEIKGGQ